jgi:pimeloyl-ACP methyl ester carboxylesterase
MPKVKANGIRIEYDSFGTRDGAPILLIAGLGEQLIDWTVPFCEILAAKGFWVIRFDNRDVGLSSHFTEASVPDLTAVATASARGALPDLPYTLHDMADDAVGLLDAVEIEQAHIVGRSLGGMIAQLIASEHRERTLSLTSIMSTSGNPALPPSTPKAMAVWTQHPPHPSQDEQGFLDHRVRAARVLSSPGFPFNEAAQRAQAIAAVKRAYNPAGFARQLAAFLASGDHRARLRTIAARTLVIHGADDPVFPLEAGQDTAANVPGAEFTVFEGMGHEIPCCLYESIAQAIEQHANFERYDYDFFPDLCASANCMVI